MKSIRFRPTARRGFLLAACLLLSSLTGRPAAPSLPPETAYQPAAGEFDPLGRAVIALLKTGRPGVLTNDLAATPADWQSLDRTNLSAEDRQQLKTFAKGTGYNARKLTADAQAVLDRAKALHLDFSSSNLQFQITPPRHIGRIYWSAPTSGGLNLPYVDHLDIVLIPAGETNPATNNVFRLTARGLQKFPGGWRINNDIQWTGFPTNVADAKTLRELALLTKIAAFQPVTAEDDPTLLQLGEALVRFVRHPDPAAYEKDLLLNGDMVWTMLEKSGRPGPTRKEVDDEVAEQNRDQAAAAKQLIRLMTDAGIDLKDADIRIENAQLGHCQSEGGAGSLDNLIGEQYQLKLAVQSGAKARTGTSLSGEYVLGVKQLTKMGGDWKITGEIHWVKLPEGVVDSQTVSNLEFENYVDEHGALPPGAAAPDIGVTTLAGGTPLKLSDLRGKVVVVDFWATWCGPCQQPMADLQKIRDQHPDWRDRVAIMPVSIDDTLDIVRRHVDQRGWTNTFNVWAGEGGWHSAPAKSFRVTGVPTSYVIDPNGKIVWSGYPIGDNIANSVDYVLKK